ncbi:MAG TPA: AgmX/PglI C-terminal domain-containing protein [Polyangia bacterium]|nr:AgmX/PglI C-terminal domain-containing protein [Polyangia bacterium]
MDTIEVEGSEAIEVVAQFDGAIVDVAHIVRDDGADSAEVRRRWLAGAGTAALAVAGVAFLCAYGGVALGRAVDVVVAACLAFGTWAIARTLSQGRFAPARAYTIGPDPRASFAITGDDVPSRCHPLVRVDEAGDFVLGVASGMTATLTLDGATVTLDPRAHKLAAGARACVKAGGATFFVANVPAPRRQPMAPAIDWTREVYLGGVALVASAFLFLIYAIPPSPESLALDPMAGKTFAQFRIVPPEVPPPPPMLGPPSDTAATGKAARGQAGRLGKATATARVGKIALPGPVSREKAIAEAQRQVRNAGILPMLAASEGTHVGSIFGRGSALGDDAPDLLLGLQGTMVGDAYSPGGLDEMGHGPGGGGDGDHTIGVGPIGGIGFCRGAACRDAAKAYAKSAPLGDLEHRAKAPDVVPGNVNVHCGSAGEGCLDKEIIRRVIRQHKNEVRYCYERGLATRPELEGRVVTSFTIANTGRVLGSAVTETSLRERDVEACIAEAVRRWEFPSSAQTSMVSYPFMLTPPR